MLGDPLYPVHHASMTPLFLTMFCWLGAKANSARPSKPELFTDRMGCCNNLVLLDRCTVSTKNVPCSRVSRTLRSGPWPRTLKLQKRELRRRPYIKADHPHVTYQPELPGRPLRRLHDLCSTLFGRVNGSLLARSVTSSTLSCSLVYIRPNEVNHRFFEQYRSSSTHVIAGLRVSRA